MLSYTRHEDETRTVWVDALSIRQDELNEKSEQVRMIHLIFLQASQVIVWLGLSANDSDILFAELKRSAAEGELYSADDHKTRLYNAYQALLARPYWGRTWIIQEIYLAQRLLLTCGHAALSGTDFNHGLVNARQLGHNLRGGDLHDYAVKIIEYIHPQGNPFRTMPTIFDALEWHDRSQCLDIKDRIFALQNMLRKDGPTQIEDPPIVQADYRMSTHGLFFRLVNAWEQYMTLPYVPKARNALRISHGHKAHGICDQDGRAGAWCGSCGWSTALTVTDGISGAQ